MSGARALSAYEAHVWRSFAGVARAWRDEPRRRTAEMITRWARIAFKTQAPGAGDIDWLRQVLRAIEAGRDFAGADFVRREALWSVIEPVLDRLDREAGPHPGEDAPPAPAQGASPPYYLRD